MAGRRRLSKTDESGAHQSETGRRLSSTRRWGLGVICYRLEFITGIDVNVSGVKEQRVVRVRCGLILYVLYERKRAANGPKRCVEESSDSLSTNVHEILIKGRTYGHINGSV